MAFIASFCRDEEIRLQRKTVMIFTNSVDKGHRVTRLLELFGIPAREYSSNLSHADRSWVVEQMRNGEVVVQSAGSLHRCRPGGRDFVFSPNPPPTPCSTGRGLSSGRHGAEGTYV